jgi:hypothetical protein
LANSSPGHRAGRPRLVVDERRSPIEDRSDPEIDHLLAELLARVRTILKHEFVGMYLYGSLATGGFQTGRSDIDFVVVTTGSLSRRVIRSLELMHEDLWQSGGHWAGKLEGAYVPAGVLRRHQPDGPDVPTVNEGRFYLSPLGADWVIQRLVLRRSPTVLAGPPPGDLVDPVDLESVRAAVRAVLREWWAPMLADPSPLKRPGYQPFAVLSMCRALHTLETGEVGSKTQAARWALHTLPGEWSTLIHRALAWRDGQPIDSIERTLEFMRVAIGRALSRDA